MGMEYLHSRERVIGQNSESKISHQTGTFSQILSFKKNSQYLASSLTDTQKNNNSDVTLNRPGQMNDKLTGQQPTRQS